MTDTIPKYRQNMQNRNDSSPFGKKLLEFRYTGIKNRRWIGYFISADVTRVQHFTSESQVTLETLINAFRSCAEGGKAGFGTSDIKI